MLPFTQNSASKFQTVPANTDLLPEGITELAVDQLALVNGGADLLHPQPDENKGSKPVIPVVIPGNPL